jgi:hypothetical protein
VVAALGLFAGGPLLANSSEKFLEFEDHNRGVEGCGLLSMPGDFMLQEIHEDDDETLESIFGTPTVYLARLKELLSLHLPTIKLVHADIISEILGRREIMSWGFYRASAHSKREKAEFKRYTGGSIRYRKGFEVYRAKGMTAESVMRKRERALERVARKETYGQKGICSDFVNWAYEEEFTSWWNFIPVFRRVLAEIYPPEAISTPDDLANSPYSAKVCEVEDFKNWIYPKSVCTKQLMEQIEAGLASKNRDILKHSQNLEKYLVDEKIIDSQHEVLIDKLHFVKPLSPEERVQTKASCSQCLKEERFKLNGREQGASQFPYPKACEKICLDAEETQC